MINEEYLNLVPVESKKYIISEICVKNKTEFSKYLNKTIFKNYKEEVIEQAEEKIKEEQIHYEKKYLIKTNKSYSDEKSNKSNFFPKSNSNNSKNRDENNNNSNSVEDDSKDSVSLDKLENIIEEEEEILIPNKNKSTASNCLISL